MPCPNCTCSSCLTGSPVVSESVTPDPPTHLGTTNQCPTNSETPYLKGVIERAQEAFAVIDEKSKQAKVLLDGLLEQRAQLLVTIDKHKAILSPLRRFPAEILGEIFMAYLALEGMVAPILLANLCSRWRGIALNTPRLWSKLNLYVSPANATRNKNILGAYIPRSGQVPLDVTITSPSWLDDTSGLGDIFQDLLVPQAHRWEHLLIDVSADLHVKLAPMLKGHLHSLKSIAFVRSFCHHDKIKLVDCYLGAPKITDVFTAGICHLPLPWPQLRNWKTTVAMDACHSVLREAANLVDWTVDLLPPTDISHPLPLNFQHSRLISLDVKFHYNTSVSHIGLFFSAITLPSLQKLSLTTLLNGDQLDMATQSSIITFFQRSSPPLTTFRISLKILPHSDDFLIACLECIPSLVDLTIEIPQQNKIMVTDQFMRRLNVKYPGFILPKLERLSLYGYMKFTSRSIAAMVASRMRATATKTHSLDVAVLQHLSLRLDRIHKSSPLNALQPFISNGLRVECSVSGRRK